MSTGRNTAKRLSSIPAPESAPRSKERLKDLRSEITDLKRILPADKAPGFALDDAIPRTMPSGGWHRLANALVEMSVHHVVLSQWSEARSTAMDALLLLDMLEENRAWADLSFTLGEVLLTLSEAHRARERFEDAATFFDDKGDLESSAKSKVGLARAMTMLRDPVGRAVLEDAGTLFEEAGNEEAAKLIDVELRELTAVLEESPTSFQAITPRRK
jgi:hypothetical protein